MKKHIPSLNGLRAISILIVIFSHVNIANFSGALAQKTRFLDGQFGVTVFFIISGFLITTLLMKEEERTGMVSLRNFYFKRALRILPVFFILLAVYGLMQAFGILNFTTASWLTSLTYTKNFHWRSDWESAHLWSLSIEEQFYLFWPLIFIYWKKYRVHFAVSILVLSPVCRILGTLHQHVGFDQFSIFQRCDAIMWGCVFALYHRDIRSYIEKKTANRKWMLVLPFVFLAAIDTFVQVNFIYNLHLGFLIVPIGNITGTLGCIAIATIMLISIHYTEGLWFKFLNTKLLNYIGTLSYSLYIWQQIFFSPRVGMFSSIPLNLLMIFVVANCSYYFIEKPFLKKKKNAEIYAGIKKEDVNPWIAALIK